MTAIVILLGLLAAATVTDIRSHRIYNWNCYPGMLAGMLLNTVGAGPGPSGAEGLLFSFAGFLACGFIMLVAFVFFQMGGGDVKLLAMIGSFLGLEQGIEALLWTFTIGFLLGISLLIWRLGALRIVTRSYEHIIAVLKARSWIPLNREERKPLEHGLFLAPSALIAVGIVVWPSLATILTNL